MLVSEEGFKNVPRLVSQRLRFPALSGVGKIPGQEDQFVGGCCDLIRGKWDSSGVNEVNSRFDIVYDHFEGMVEVIRKCHTEIFLLKGCGGNLVVINLEVSNYLEVT